MINIKIKKSKIKNIYEKDIEICIHKAKIFKMNLRILVILLLLKMLIIHSTK